MKDEGFSLIELIVVIFILSIATALIIPSFMDTGEGALKSDAKRIGSVFRHLYDEAASRKETYILTINLDKNSYSFKDKGKTRSFSIKDEVYLKDVLIPSLGEISDGEVTIEFGPLGPEEPVILHLATEKEDFTVIFNNINGRTTIYEGYRL